MTVFVKQLPMQCAFFPRKAVVLAVVLVALFSATASAQIFFSPYKDVTVSANWNTGEQQSAVTGTTEAVTSAMPANDSTLSWAFATGDCGSENWGGITPALESSNVQDFVNAGKYYVVSTGGSAGTFDCPSDSGMQTFIDTYYSTNMLGVDYDIELGQSQAIIDDLINSTIYAEQRYPSMRFSFTLQTLGAATSGSDLNSTGDEVMSEISRLGLGGNYYIDLMAFDYGSVSSGTCVVSGSNCDMAQSAIAAAESLHSKFGTPYSQIELCLMIGQADSGPTETLSLANVDTIVAWAQSVGLGGIHFWSFDRDQPSASSSPTGDGASNPPLSYNKQFTADLGSCTGPGGSCGSSSGQPSFSLSDSPSSLSIAQGASGASTITVASRDGFDSVVSLSVSGLPSGVTASLSHSTVTPPADGSTTSTLTLSASSSATAGTATVTITGTNGGLTTTTTLSLSVTSPNGCAAAWSSTQVYTAGMTASESGIDYLANYWTEGNNPATNNGGAGSGEPWTSQGTCGTQSSSFTLSDSPSSLSIAQGAAGTSTISVRPANGFSGSVTLAASGLPSGVTASFGTNPTTGTSLLTLTASSSATAGSSTVTITGTSGSLSASTSIALTVTSSGTPSFTLSDSPSSLSISRGASGTSTITVASRDGFDSAVSLSVSGLPSGVTASFSPSSATPSADGSTTSTLTLTASSSATAATATVTITGASGSLSATTTIALTVTAASSGGSVTLSPSSHNFGSTAPDTGTAWVTFTLANSGSSAVSISSVSVSGPFVLSSSCGSSVAANSSCPIYVYFYPAAAGSFTGTLTVDDGASNSPQTASLSGTGS
jgi:chitinase